ncbi:hypothetical protein [Filomicrobium insigne]|nr:hypothetical protein [Filomicrobium insigne]
MIDAQQLGRSLAGIGRLYRSVNHFYFTGKMPTKIRKSEVQILVGPPQEGSISYALWVLIAHGTLPMYPQLLAEFSDICTPEVVKAVIAKRAGQTKIAEKAIDKIAEIAEHNAELSKRFIEYAQLVEAGHQERARADQQDKAKLLGVIERLGQLNASAMTEMVAPVGPSVRQLVHSKGDTAEYVIDEPVADAIRSRGVLEVQEAISMTVRIEAVDKIRRTCKIISGDGTPPITGKITDPVVTEPQNVYTRALDNATPIVVTGKPVLKDGDWHAFYISGARALE